MAGEEMIRVLVIGLGEVGSAIYDIILKSPKHLVEGFDVEPKEIDFIPDIMHICIPYNQQFIRSVINYMKKYKPALTIIESTVKPFTTQEIYAETRMPVCHSPVRGNHREGLVKGLYKYTKFIGAPKRQFALMAERYYNSLGIKTQVCSSSLETEFMKILNTSYYALLIAWFQEIRRLCLKYNLNESEIKHFFLTNTVESNYQHMRPILYPSKIGGHCLIPNLKLLEEFSPEFVKLILWSNNNLEVNGK